MIRAVLSIGSNMADRLALLRQARDAFAPELVAASRVYETPPWGVEDQDPFLNAVLIIHTQSTPLELLRRAQAVEQAAQRVRERRWGPRTLDIDIITATDLTTGQEITSTTPTLTLPHPHAHHRDFVLIPWLDADPHATLSGKAVTSLITGPPLTTLGDL